MVLNEIAELGDGAFVVQCLQALASLNPETEIWYLLESRVREDMVLVISRNVDATSSEKDQGTIVIVAGVY